MGERTSIIIGLNEEPKGCMTIRLGEEEITLDEQMSARIREISDREGYSPQQIAELCKGAFINARQKPPEDHAESDKAIEEAEEKAE